MKNILFIIYSYTMGGGAETLLTTIVNNLNPKKYKIDILELLHDDVKVEIVNKNITILPYIMRADDPQRKSKMYYVYHEPETVFNKFVHKGYDLYVAFNFQRPSFLLPKGKKNIVWVHGSVYNFAGDDKREERELQCKAFQNVKNIVSVSDVTTQSLIDLFPGFKEKIIELHNGIDIDFVRHMSMFSTDVRIKHPAILSIGKLDENKNPLRLLNVFEEVHKINGEAHLYYLGWDLLNLEVQRIAKEKNLLENVHFLGYHQNPFPIIRQCDVSCLLSRSEGFPMCLLESQCLGKPIVATSVGGVKILTKTSDACGVAISTDEEAVKAILKYINMDKNRIQVECEKSVKRFDLTDYMTKIEALFDHAINVD